MQNSREQQGEISNEQCKQIEETTEWERLEISSGKLEIARDISCKYGLDKEQKWYGTNRSRRY